MRYLVIACMILASILAAAAEMSHEETMVRTAYARLTYAAELRIVALDAMRAPGATLGAVELKAQIANLTPHFEIDNVAVGNLSAIAGLPWEQMVTKPDGELIDVGSSGVWPETTTPDGETKRTGKSMFYVMTGWGNHVYEPSWDGITVAEVVKDSPKPLGEGYSTYISYRVNAKLSGRSRTYNAMFFFGRDAKGNEAIHMVDHVIGMGSLDLVLSQSLYPEVLLETYWREIPEITEWIVANTIPKQTESKDVYCLPSGCGLPANWATRSLAVPIDPESRKFLPLDNVQRSSVGQPQGSPPPGAASCSALTTNSSVPSINNLRYFRPQNSWNWHGGAFC
jgi:hypothetical protein